MQTKANGRLVIKIPRNTKPQTSGVDGISDGMEIIIAHQSLIYVIIFDEDVCSFEMEIDKWIYHRIVSGFSFPLYVELSGSRHEVR